MPDMKRPHIAARAHDLLDHGALALCVVTAVVALPTGSTPLALLGCTGILVWFVCHSTDEIATVIQQAHAREVGMIASLEVTGALSRIPGPARVSDRRYGILLDPATPAERVIPAESYSAAMTGAEHLDGTAQRWTDQGWVPMDRQSPRAI